MTDFGSTWGSADPDATGGSDDLEPPIDGTYDVGLIDGDAFESKAGAPFVKLKFRVVSIDQQDYEWVVLLGFKSPAQANMTKRAVRDLGVPVDTIVGLEQLGESIKSKVGEFYAVEVKTNGEFRNTYIQDSRPVAPDIPLPDMAAMSTAPVATDDDDIPF